MATSRPIDLCTRSYFLTPGTFVSSVSYALSRLSGYMLSQHSHEHGCHEAVSAIQACALRMNTLVASTETETAAAFVYLTVACAAENHNSWRAVEYLEGVKARINLILDAPNLPTYAQYHQYALGPSGLNSYLANATTVLEFAFNEITQEPAKQVFNAPGQALINLHEFRNAPELSRGHIPAPLQHTCDIYYAQLLALFQRWRNREDAQRMWWSRWCPDGEEYRYWVLLAHLLSPLYYHPEADLRRLIEPFNQFNYHCIQLEVRLTEAAFDIDASRVLDQLGL